MSFQIAKVMGIPIRLHFTLLITFVLITWTVAIRFTPNLYPGLASFEYWIVGFLAAIVLFVSVFLHELSHSILAKRYGLHVREIILFVFGGVSNIEDLDAFGERKITTAQDVSREFRREFKIAVAGPVTSFAIAAILALLFLLVSQGSLHSDFGLKSVAEVVLLYGTIVNTILGAFNLVPAFPLDGGRILRAGLLRWKKDYEKATKIAARIGIIISYALMGLGFIMMFFGELFSGLWIVLIGWFLNKGAQSYISQYEFSFLLRGVILRDIMNTNVIHMKDNITINESLRVYFNRYAKDSFPVLDDESHILGLVTFRDASDTPEAERDRILVKDIMIPATDLITMSQDGSADEAFMKMIKVPVRRIFVCDEKGKLTGLVSKTDIMNIGIQRKNFIKKTKKS